MRGCGIYLHCGDDKKPLGQAWFTELELPWMARFSPADTMAFGLFRPLRQEVRSSSVMGRDRQRKTMSSITETAPIRVKMGGIGFGKGAEKVETLLGSCVGVAIWDRITKVGGLAHVVLPESAGREAPPGKFADTAIVEMKKQLRAKGANPRTLAAKIAGGSTMFGKRTERDVGEKNYRAVKKYLAQEAIPLLAEHIGGSAGRMVIFSPKDGSMAVFVARKLVATI